MPHIGANFLPVVALNVLASSRLLNFSRLYLSFLRVSFCPSSVELRSYHQQLVPVPFLIRIASSPRCSQSGPVCSKLTTSLVNVSLNFQKLISQIGQYFLLKKCEELLQCIATLIFSIKNFSVFGYKVVKHLMS